MSKTLHFSQDEIMALKESWIALWSDKTNNGIKILNKLWKTHPETKILFREFKDIREDDMSGNKRLRGLALSIMYKLTEYMDSLDDPESLEDHMIKTSKAHHKREVGPKQFEWLGKAIADVVKETMVREHCKGIHQESWIKLMKKVAAVATGVQRTLKEDNKLEIPELSGVWRSPRSSPIPFFK